MPPRKKVVTGILTGVGENHWSEPSRDHMSMHSGGVEPSVELLIVRPGGLWLPLKTFNVLRLPYGQSFSPYIRRQLYLRFLKVFRGLLI